MVVWFCKRQEELAPQGGNKNNELVFEEMLAGCYLKNVHTKRDALPPTELDPVMEARLFMASDSTFVGKNRTGKPSTNWAQLRGQGYAIRGASASAGDLNAITTQIKDYCYSWSREEMEKTDRLPLRPGDPMAYTVQEARAHLEKQRLNYAIDPKNKVKVGEEIAWYDQALEQGGWNHSDHATIGLPSGCLLDPDTPQESRPMTMTKDAAVIAWGMNDVTYDAGNMRYGCHVFEEGGELMTTLTFKIFAFTQALRHFPRAVVFCGHDQWEEAYGPEMEKWTSWARQLLNTLGVTALPLDKVFEEFRFHDDCIHFTKSEGWTYDWNVHWNEALKKIHVLLSLQAPW